MRAFLIVLCACGAAAPTEPRPPTSTMTNARRPASEPIEPVDVIASLIDPLTVAAWIAPGPAQLVLGAETLHASEGATPLEVGLVEEQGGDVRVGVRLTHARFALWMSRDRLLPIVTRDVRVDRIGLPATGPFEVVLRKGARVHRLARKDKRTQVRYIGAVEVEGWVPDDALGDRGPAGHTSGLRVPRGGKPLMVRQGAVIRTDVKWASPPLAVVNHGHFVDSVRELDAGWHEVAYQDGDVRVRGFLSKRDPPGRITRPPKSAGGGSAITPNATVADGTCLYLAEEKVGFLVGDQQVQLDRGSRVGWFVVAIDTPWGPIAFDARGPTETELETCGE